MATMIRMTAIMMLRIVVLMASVTLHTKKC